MINLKLWEGDLHFDMFIGCTATATSKQEHDDSDNGYL